MRWLKPVLGTVALVLFVRYSTVYYHAYELGEFISEEVHKTSSKAVLQERIMKGAEQHNVALTEEDIAITKKGSLLSVELNYRVPVSYLVANHVLDFHAAASGTPQKFAW